MPPASSLLPALLRSSRTVPATATTRTSTTSAARLLRPGDHPAPDRRGGTPSRSEMSSRMTLAARGADVRAGNLMISTNSPRRAAPGGFNVILLDRRRGDRRARNAAQPPDSSCPLIARVRTTMMREGAGQCPRTVQALADSGAAGSEEIATSRTMRKHLKAATCSPWALGHQQRTVIGPATMGTPVEEVAAVSFWRRSRRQ